jgi:hypothetical protein
MIVFLVLSWMGLTFLSIRRHVLGIAPKLERKEIIFWTIASIGSIIYSVDYVANHWPHISIPFPQGNATTIILPRLVPPLPSLAAWALLVLICAALVIGVAMEIYGVFRPAKLPVYEPPQIEIEKADEPPERFVQIGRAEAERKQELEEIDRRRRDIYNAIKEWVQPPETRWQIGGQQEPLYLAERHPKYTQKIDACLSQNYHQIWADWQEFKRVYGDLMAIRENPPEECYERIDGKLTFYTRRLEARENSMRSQLLAMQRQLVQQINLEIVEKHDTELRC